MSKRSWWDDPEHWGHDVIIYGYGVFVLLAVTGFAAFCLFEPS